MFIILTYIQVILEKIHFWTEPKLDLKLQEFSIQWFRCEMHIQNHS